MDIYAIGFEEMVDLDTKNIVSTSGSNAREWSGELLSTLNRTGRDHYCQVTMNLKSDITSQHYTQVTYTQLVGVCLYLFVREELAAGVRDVAVDQVISIRSTVDSVDLLLR